MSILTTKKELIRNYGKFGLAVGYCDACHILHYEDKLAHTAGIYGWNFDAYDINGLLICTGYRGMIGNRPRFLDKYEKKAKEICENWDIPYKTKIKKVKALLNKWIEKETALEA